jgi:hypothetical protein
MTAWRPPASQAKQDELAIAYARDGYALAEAVYGPSSPPWRRELPAVDVLRRVLVQTCTRTITGNGQEVIKRREKEPEGDGLPPGHARIASPHDTDARWGVKRAEFWLGYKLHVTETCDDEPRCGCPAAGDGGTGRRHDQDCAAPAFPNLITHVGFRCTFTVLPPTRRVRFHCGPWPRCPGRAHAQSGLPHLRHTAFSAPRRKSPAWEIRPNSSARRRFSRAPPRLFPTLPGRSQQLARNGRAGQSGNCLSVAAGLGAR